MSRPLIVMAGVGWVQSTVYDMVQESLGNLLFSTVYPLHGKEPWVEAIEDHSRLGQGFTLWKETLELVERETTQGLEDDDFDLVLFDNVEGAVALENDELLARADRIILFVEEEQVTFERAMSARRPLPEYEQLHRKRWLEESSKVVTRAMLHSGHYDWRGHGKRL